MTPDPNGPPKKLKDLARGFLESGVFPGGVIALGKPAVGSSLTFPFGFLGKTRNVREVTADSSYDLASVTKIVATTFMVALSVAEKRLKITDPLGDLGFEGPDEVLSLTLEDLLTHRSGLPPWKPVYLAGGEDPAERRAAVEKLVLNRRLLFKPGTRTLYSDLGFMLLGFVLEKIWGIPLGTLFDELVAKPLSLVSAVYGPRSPAGPGGLCPLKAYPFEIAPTEDGFRVGGPLTLPGVPIFGPAPSGRVHDDNAAFLSGAAGHAGLFSNAGDLFKILVFWSKALKNEVPSLPSAVLSDFMTPRATAEDPGRALGFDVFPRPGGGGILLGHLGYTGCSVHFDPKEDEALILLSNRVHPTARGSRMDGARASLLDLCFGERLFDGQRPTSVPQENG
ncbi:MAG: beta-lactamase family protein [Deltaproteobacteria bacterium]|jgi:CubicO group peptidase (beta-lactamase class C family)|nr:beta-lactamase family protein [Deltaproteobacteria bacterium]